MTAYDIVSFLSKFDSDCITLNQPVLESEILKFELEYNLVLPTDFKELIKLSNGFGLLGVEVFGLDSQITNSIEKVYEFEHRMSEGMMASNLIPFSPDGAGNHYCFDISTLTEKSCNIIFWLGGYEYALDEKPEITHDSFTAWVQEVVVDWTLAHYNFSGENIS